MLWVKCENTHTITKFHLQVFGVLLISTFIKCKIVDSHELCKGAIFMIIITNKFDRLQETEKYQWKTSYKEDFKNAYKKS